MGCHECKCTCNIGERRRHKLFIDFLRGTSADLKYVPGSPSHPPSPSRSRTHEKEIQPNQCDGGGQAEELVGPVGLVHV